MADTTVRLMQKSVQFCFNPICKVADWQYGIGFESTWVCSLPECLLVVKCVHKNHSSVIVHKAWSRDERTLQPVKDYEQMWRRRQRWAAKCKNALQQLNELRPGLEYRIVSQTGPCHRPVFTVHLQLSGETFEGVGLTKQKAKMAAAERALRHGFVQFRNVEPISSILQTRARDVINPCDDVIDFSNDDSLTSQSASVVTIFTDFSLSSPSSLAISSSSAAAAAENDVSQEAVMTSSG